VRSYPVFNFRTKYELPLRTIEVDRIILSNSKTRHSTPSTIETGQIIPLIQSGVVLGPRGSPVSIFLKKKSVDPTCQFSTPLYLPTLSQCLPLYVSGPHQCGGHARAGAGGGGRREASRRELSVQMMAPAIGMPKWSSHITGIFYANTATCTQTTNQATISSENTNHSAANSEPN
jgi:hypothetical protein